MESTYETAWERSLEEIARKFEYPPTPDVAVVVRRPSAAGDHGRQTTDHRPRFGGRPSSGDRIRLVRRLGWALLLIALFAATALAVPQTRAAVLSFFARIGAIDIFIDEVAPTAIPFPAPTAEDAGLLGPPAVRPAATQPATPALRTIAHSLQLFQLGDSTTLADARQRMSFPLAIPDELGEPDEVYVHSNTGLPAVSFVWRDPDGELVSLTEIGESEFARKLLPEGGVKYLRMGDVVGIWIESPHTLELFGDSHQDTLRIESNVLIWTEGDVTYRLEGDLTEEEMVAIAGSLGE